MASTSQGSFDSDTDSGTLTVTGISPKMRVSPQPQKVTIGTDVLLFCTVESDPPADFIWFKNGSRVDYNNLRYQLDESTGTLTLKNAQSEDSAKYVCQADNGYGKPAIASAFVDIREASEVLDRPESQPFVAGQNYTFPCAVKVDERIKDSVNVTWLKDGVPLAVDLADNLELDSEHTLTVWGAGDEDVGEYLCRVRTDVDEVRMVASIYKSGRRKF